MKARGKVKHAEISAVVTRADGTVDNYGVVAASSLWFRLIGRHIAARRTQRLNRR